MTRKISNYPGYIGYNVIANEVLQTGVHCCDIATHISEIKNNPALTSALKFLENPASQSPSFFGYIQDYGYAIATAQTTLNQFLQLKRRQLCEYAIRNIQNSPDSLIYCVLLAPEIKASLVEDRDFKASDLDSEVYIDGLNAIEQFNLGNVVDLDDFCQKPEVCIDYIRHYYLQGNKPNDDPLTAKMFIVPPPDSTGMLNIAAMQLQRKIIVLSARNGEPFVTEDYSNGTRPPIHIGYDGHLHFVELQPYTLSQLAKISYVDEHSDLEKAIYESIMAIMIAQQTREILPQRLLESQQLLENLKVKYAEIVTAEKTLEAKQEKFMRLLINDSRIFRDENHPQHQAALGMYSILLEVQAQWLQTSILSNVDVTREQQIQDQKQTLARKINTGFSVNENISKELVNIVWSTAESNVALEAKNVTALKMAQILKDFFVAHSCKTPIHKPDLTIGMPQITQETTWVQKLKAFFIGCFESLLKPLRSIVAFVASFMFSSTEATLDQSEQNNSDIVDPNRTQENTSNQQLQKTNSFTPLRNSQTKEIRSSVEQLPTPKNRCCIS
jgi:hypothetical protein